MYNTESTSWIRSLMALSVVVLAASGCLGGGGSDGGPVSSPDPDPPPPQSNSAPQISGTPAGAVNIGDTYTFVPNAADPDGDALTFSIENRPSWASFDSETGELTGEPVLADVGVYDEILISVSDGQASSSLARFSISVNQVGSFSASLNWEAPTLNDDGSALTDLAGYKLYWGTTPGVYPNSVTIDNPSVTTYVVENLAAGTYEFVATSYNDAGVESVYSNTATKVVP